MRFSESKTGLSTTATSTPVVFLSSSVPTDHSKAVPLLQFVLFVRHWLNMWRLFYRYLYLISPRFVIICSSFLCVLSLFVPHFSAFCHYLFLISLRLVIICSSFLRVLSLFFPHFSAFCHYLFLIHYENTPIQIY